MEPLLHFVIPFTALMILGFSLRDSLALAFLGVVSDMDALFLIHRSLSHSMVVMSLIWAPVLLYFRLRRPDLLRMGLIGLLVTFSHPLMDVVQSSTPILWPLYNKSIYIKIAFNVMWGSEVGVSPKVQVVKTPTAFKPVTGVDYPLFTGEGLVVSLVLLLPILLRILKKSGIGGTVIAES